MSRVVSFQLPIVEIEHTSGISICSIATDLQCSFLNRSSTASVRHFETAAKTALLREGLYTELLKYLPPADAEVTALAVDIPPSVKRLDAVEHSVTLPVIKWQYPRGDTLALVPGLGVGFFTRQGGDVLKPLRQAVLLEFMRHRRLEDQRWLIAAQWYRQPRVKYETISAEFYTPAELAGLGAAKQDRLLPKTASRMSRSRQKYLGFEAYLPQLLLNLGGAAALRYRQSVLIVGPSGCGKSALVYAYEQAVGSRWQDRPWATSASKMLQVLTETGGWQYGLGTWVKELRESGETVYIGNLSEWFEVGQYAGNSVSIAEALRDPLQRNEIVLIAEVTEEQLQKIELRSPGYGQLFHIVRFSERSADEENRIAGEAIKDMADHYRVAISDAAIARIISLQRRYTPYSGYPGKTIRFFETLILQFKDHSREVDESGALQAFCEESGMPRLLVDPQITLSRRRLDEFFARHIIGQQQALEAVTGALATIKTGMNRSGKPITTLLFVGPTGVGKTQMAKALAQFIFGDSQRMVRFDMSEYSDPHAVLRLTAASDSSLVARVRQQPFSVVLFDEIEKAAYNFFDLLLQVLGEGRLTDDRGDVANFCSTLVIMTSNIGAGESIKPGIGFNRGEPRAEDIVRHFENTVSRYFRPEFFNRLDHLIPFLPLTPQQQTAVLKKEVEQLMRVPGIANRYLSVSVEASVWSWLGAMNIDFRYGARAIQRVLKEKVIHPLAEVLSKHPYDHPLAVSLAAVDRQLSIECRARPEARQSLGLFAGFADQVSALRRDAQGLLEGSTWIGLLSEIDQLEHRKKKLKEKFWTDPDLTQRYGALIELLETSHKIIDNIYQLENTCVTQMQEEAPDAIWDDYENMLSLYRKTFDDLLFAVESVVNPHSNRCLLAVFGAAPWLQQVVDHYQQWLNQTEVNISLVNIYLQKDNFDAGQLSPDSEEIELNASATSTADEQEVPLPYWKSARLYRDLPLQRVGVLLSVEGVCVGHMLRKESGLVEVLDEQADKHRLFIALSDGTAADFEVPEGVHRRRFYEGRKAERLFEGNAYYDSRYSDTDTALPLAQHGEKMRRAAVDYIRQTLIHSVLIKNADDQ